MLRAMGFALPAFNTVRNVAGLNARPQICHLIEAHAAVVRLKGARNADVFWAVLTVIAAGAGDQRKPFQYGNCLSEQFLFLPG